MSDPALECVALLFGMWEQVGDVSYLQRDMLTALIPKPQGGFRPIGLFRALFRVWSRARMGDVKAWAKENIPEDTFSMLPTHKALDPVWRCQVSHLAAGEHAHTIELNWDIKKCFENVSREILCQRASATGYPPHILRLSLASYSWGRRLRGLGGIVTNDIYSNRGIVAGSAFAIFELAVYMLKDTRLVKMGHPPDQPHLPRRRRLLSR